jgi:predicted nucleic acid-binding protein
VIVDSSAWIEYLRATGSRAHQALRTAIDRREPLAVPPLVRQEVLQGARSQRDFMRLSALLDQFRRLDVPDAHHLAAHAAWLYARCRWQGITPRSPNDCLIACHAVLADLPLLAADRDFAVLAAAEPRLRLL